MFDGSICNNKDITQDVFDNSICDNLYKISDQDMFDDSICNNNLYKI